MGKAKKTCYKELQHDNNKKKKKTNKKTKKAPKEDDIKAKKEKKKQDDKQWKKNKAQVGQDVVDEFESCLAGKSCSKEDRENGTCGKKDLKKKTNSCRKKQNDDLKKKKRSKNNSGKRRKLLEDIENDASATLKTCLEDAKKDSAAKKACKKEAKADFEDVSGKRKTNTDFKQMTKRAAKNHMKPAREGCHAMPKETSDEKKDRKACYKELKKR